MYICIYIYISISIYAYTYRYIYIYVPMHIFYIYMDALVSRYLTSPSMGGRRRTIGRSLQRVLVGGARVGEGGDGEGGGGGS